MSLGHEYIKISLYRTQSSLFNSVQVCSAPNIAALYSKALWWSYCWFRNNPPWHASLPPSEYPAQIIPSVTFKCTSHSLHKSRFNTGTLTSFTVGSYDVLAANRSKWRKKNKLTKDRRKRRKTKLAFLYTNQAEMNRRENGK